MQKTGVFVPETIRYDTIQIFLKSHRKSKHVDWVRHLMRLPICVQI